MSYCMCLDAEVGLEGMSALCCPAQLCFVGMSGSRRILGALGTSFQHQQPYRWGGKVLQESDRAV